jgi:hypothetical protein
MGQQMTKKETPADLVARREEIKARWLEVGDEMVEYRADIARYVGERKRRGGLTKEESEDQADARLALKEAGAEHQRLAQQMGAITRELGGEFVVKALYEVAGEKMAVRVLQRSKELSAERRQLVEAARGHHDE